MAYRIRYTKKAVKSLKDFPKSDVLSIIEAIEQLAEAPELKTNVKTLHNFVSSYRLRVGNYRVLFDREDTLKIIDVIDVGHRKDIYQ
ncbi:type II toxin-antitoxin system RelE/ParE family toxin [Runella sp.]|jgi:mRNA interferase RelE/StbE|uniref:type II toxin-antitoxin system RelE family toxin n=1 Tax=Runella sp. TaxID=1960881 RepID=UPI0026299C3F|nr:type II toxin-antitoxin system RelE/ParE family toxin [Runella sp.]